MYALTNCDKKCDGFLDLTEFKKAFEDAKITVDYKKLEEVFTLLSEKFSEKDETKVLSFK